MPGVWRIRTEQGGCCVWQGSTKDGYPKAMVNGVTRLVHRLIYEAANGPIRPADVVRHRCDNPLCINPAHLLIGTHADNVADRVARCRSASGVRNGRAKLTPESVAAIRASPATHTELAGRYGVDRKTIRLIRAGVIWKAVGSG